MFNPAITQGNRETYLANRKPQDIQIKPTPENRKLIAEYERLAKEINDTPARIAGLRMTFRKRDLPAQVARLVVERDEKLERLLEIEKILGFTQ
jgi:predicted ATP-grasp superfamily ATP-dependent carboligase